MHFSYSTSNGSNLLQYLSQCMFNNINSKKKKKLRRRGRKKEVEEKE